MNIQKLHEDGTLRRQEFPVCKQSIFLGHAGVCPLPQRVVRAIQDYSTECLSGDQEEGFPKGQILETRGLAAHLLGCLPEEIALVGPTSIGLSLVANGLQWHSGDNVVFYAEDYPSNAVPWMALERKGVELKRVSPTRLGEITLETISSLVDTRTRLVALASAHFISGYQIDLDAIGKWLHSRGVLFCVDGIQTVGALHTSVAEVDFLAADAHKWLLGPCAAGILFVRREVQEKLQPTLLGWNNVLCPGYVTPKEVHFPRHAGRYEAGSHNLLGVTALHAALSLLKEYGYAEIEETILGHTRFLRQKLLESGFELAGATEHHLSGITSFHREGVDLMKLHRQLQEAHIITSLRQTRDGKNWIRLSPHFYNTREELEQALTLIAKVEGSPPCEPCVAN